MAPSSLCSSRPSSWKNSDIITRKNSLFWKAPSSLPPPASGCGRPLSRHVEGSIPGLVSSPASTHASLSNPEQTRNVPQISPNKAPRLTVPARRYQRCTPLLEPAGPQRTEPPRRAGGQLTGSWPSGAEASDPAQLGHPGNARRPRPAPGPRPPTLAAPPRPAPVQVLARPRRALGTRVREPEGSNTPTTEAPRADPSRALPPAAAATQPAHWRAHVHFEDPRRAGSALRCPREREGHVTRRWGGWGWQPRKP